MRILACILVLYALATPRFWPAFASCVLAAVLLAADRLIPAR